MKIFITGATGYIGSCLTDKLIRSGYMVHALVRNVKAAREVVHPHAQLFPGDISDPSSIKAGMAGCEAVFHLAGYAKLWSRNPNTFYEVNVNGTRNVLDAAVELKVKKFIYTSSCGVFGNSSTLPFSECDPRISSFHNDYDLSKHISECMIREYAKNGLHSVIVNPSRVYGPGPSTTSNAITMLIERCMNGQSVVIPRSRNVIANYAFIDDVVYGHVAAWRFGVAGQRYILGGENLTYQNVLNVIGEQISIRKVISVPPAVLKGIGLMNIVKTWLTGVEPSLTPGVVRRITQNAAFDCSKAVFELKYRITPFADGIRVTIARLNSK